MINGVLAFLLLLIAAALLLLAAAAVGRSRGRPASRSEDDAKILMLGLAIGFLTYFLLASVLFVFPVAVAALLAWSWLHRGSTAEPGLFLLAFGGLWTILLGWQRWNDLSDPAVSIPEWTVYPLAAGVAMLVAGVWLRVTARR